MKETTLKSSSLVNKIIYSNRRSFGLEIDEEANLIIRAPKRATNDDILRVLNKKQSWISKKTQEVLSREKIEYSFVDGEKFLFLGNYYSLILDKDISSFSFDKNNFLLNPRIIDEAHGYFVSWYKAQASKIVKYRAEHYAIEYDFNYNRMRISDAKTRWGSCSSKRNININWRLVLAPLPVLDYVIIHELCHLKELNHSYKFWQLVENIQPNYRDQINWLTKNHRLLKF